jgi:hypothetical protein
MLVGVAYIACVECGEVTGTFERGWRGYYAEDESEALVALITYCPACARREFGVPDLADTDDSAD